MASFTIKGCKKAIIDYDFSYHVESGYFINELKWEKIIRFLFDKYDVTNNIISSNFLLFLLYLIELACNFIYAWKITFLSYLFGNLSLYQFNVFFSNKL